MANRLISDDEFFERTLNLFRTHGYDGVSLSRLAAATGLEKASLYYRFPGGKEDLAAAVVERMGRRFSAEILEPLRDPGPWHARIVRAATQLNDFYAGGTKWCVTDVLSLAEGTPKLKAALRQALENWIEAFAAVARENGCPPAKARARAQEAVGRIQGALVVSRVLRDSSLFRKVIKTLPDLLAE